MTASRPVRRELAPFEDFTGRLERPEPVPVVARVSGRVADAPVKPGSEVKKGDLLFQIDPAPLKETLAAAEAKRDGAAAGPERDAAEAAVRRARQELDAARIVAPADGRFTFSARLARPDERVSGAWDRPVELAVVISPDAMGLVFDMDERSYLRYRRLLAAREVRGECGPLSVGLADEEGMPHEGVLARFQNHFNPGAGALDVHGVFPDPDHLFLPGMFARVRVPFGKPAPVLEIADSAIASDQGKRYVWVVGDHNVVERREVRLGRRDGDLIVVKEGLGPDDWVVVAGGNDLHAGNKVEPCRTAMPGSKTGPRP